jgi:oligo-alginate lyase
MRTFWILLTFFFSLNISAQQHPYLFFTKDRMDVLKNRIQADTSIASNWKSIVREADQLLDKGDARGKTDYLSVVYLITGDKRYSNKIRDVLVKLCTQPTWSNAEMLQRNPPWTSDLKTAENCWAVAIGYDAVYNLLTKEERKTIIEGLVRMGIKPALSEWVWPDTRIHTLNSMGHNWWSACVGMAGMASLAIMDDYPEAKNWVGTVSKAFEEWYCFNGDELQNKPKTIDAKGGMYESMNYSAFGSSEYFFFRLACMNAMPQLKQPDLSGLNIFAQWFMHVCYPRTGPLYSLNFGDGDLTVAGERPVKLLYALGFKDPNDLWYLNQVTNAQHREGLSPNTPIGIVYQPDMSKAPQLPDLPTSALFEDMDWATMRTSWEKDATLLGIKCGYTWNHSHADAGSFILFHKGEDIIKDAGNSWYGSKEYSQYFCQSEAHNVVLFNGKAQPKEQEYNGSPLRGQLSELMDAGNIKYIQANATGPTSANFARNFRHFIWLDKVIIIIDDVKAYETGKFQWLLHPGGDAKKTGGDISIIKNKSAVLVRPLFPETLVQTGFDHDFPEKMKITEVTAPKARDPQNPTETYYAIGYPEEVKQTKFITAIILKDSVNDTHLPVIERLHNETMRGVRITQNGKVTELYLNLLADGHIMHLNSCNTFEGWDTDAYLFGFSYPEGKKDSKREDVKDYFMAYGSYIRKDGETIFSSLSKVYMMARTNEHTLQMILKGQPLISATFLPGNKPRTLILNQKLTEPVYSGKKLQICMNDSGQ